MHLNLLVPACALFMAGCIDAQPSVCAVVSTAIESALTPGPRIPVCPGYRAVAAPGSLVAVTGTGLGPAVAEGSSEFPLRINMAGVSVRITIGAAASDAFVMS